MKPCGFCGGEATALGGLPESEAPSVVVSFSSAREPNACYLAEDFARRHNRNALSAPAHEHADRIVEALRCRVFEVAQAIWNAIQTVHKPMRWRKWYGSDSEKTLIICASNLAPGEKNQCD